MSETYAMILFAVVLSGILLWLLIKGEKPSRKGAPPLHPGGAQALPAAKHYAYFPQIRQSLSRADSDYLLKNAPPGVAKRALRERRDIARRFLQGLHEDFSNLARLGRIIAALSPEVSHKQEATRFMLSVNFRFLYALVWLRLAAGTLPLHQLEILTGLVGRLAARIDEAMTEISALSTDQLAGKMNA
jgi:hypothetical protein